MANDSAHPAPTFGEDVFFEEWYKNRVHKKSRADKFGSSSRDAHHVIKSTARHLAMEIYLDEMSLQFGRHVQLMDDADGEVPARNGPREKKRRRLKGVMYTRLANGDIQQLSPLQSTWYNLYCRGEEIGTSLIPGFAEKFRKRFRMPYGSYLDLVTLCQEDSMRDNGHLKRWQPGKASVEGKPCTPLELLVLTALRYLGRGWTFDDLEESTAVSAEVIRVFFHAFVQFGSDILFSKWVSPPTTVEDAQQFSTEYSVAGFPGCVGSMDATNIECSRISYKFRQDHLSFKTPFCSRTYNITTNHRRRILSTTHGHPARWNDKTLVKFDSFATGLNEGTSELCNLVFELYEKDATGNVQRQRYKGGWLLVDNGYLNWGVTVAPMKVSDTRAQLRFSKWLESMRKDVECTFGILKGRWRILKAGVRVHGTKKADMIWKTCCALHNWLLEVDGLDKHWQSDWVGDMGNLDYRDLPSGVQAAILAVNNRYDTSRMGYGNDRSVEDTNDDEFDDDNRVIATDSHGCIIVHSLKMKDFREKLVQHFDIAFKNNEVCWPRARMNNREQPNI
jgi:hypothetical protein